MPKEAERAGPRPKEEPAEIELEIEIARRSSPSGAPSTSASVGAMSSKAPRRMAASIRCGRYGEIWRDMARYGELWGSCGGDVGEMWARSDLLAVLGEHERDRGLREEVLQLVVGVVDHELLEAVDAEHLRDAGEMQGR